MDKKPNLQELLDQRASEPATKLYQRDAETRARISASLTGRTHSAETRSKISANHKGGYPKGGLKGPSPLLGREFTAEQRQNVSKGRKGIPAKNRKPIMTPNGPFPSLSAVAEAAGVKPGKVWIWMKRWPEHYYYIKEV